VDIYEQLGVKKVINALGTVTKIGGSLMNPKVLEAMTEASKAYVNISDLHSSAGKRIAEYLGVEAACITSGASAGIAVCAAACMAGKNIGNILQLPDTKGMKNEVVMMKSHRILYDQALLLSGIKVIEVGTTSYCCSELVENALNEHTAMFFYVAEAQTMRGSIPLEEISALMKRYNIPVVVDAAAEIPPTTNISHFLDQQADLVILSGGKEIRGPQSSGLILGDKELIQACNLNCSPHYSIGRSMKIDKETIVGITKAVELFSKKDYQGEMKRWDKMVEKLREALQDEDMLEVTKGYPIEPGVQPTVIPRLYITWGREDLKRIQESMSQQDPSVQVGIEQGKIAINPQCLKDEEVVLVIQAIKKVLGE
jgi:L-seryl-tRNA(Ser) seleniumtransferase